MFVSLVYVKQSFFIANFIDCSNTRKLFFLIINILIWIWNLKFQVVSKRQIAIKETFSELNFDGANKQ